MNLFFELIMETMLSGVAGVGFCVLFNIRGDKAKYSVITNMISWFSYGLCLRIGVALIPSLLFASIAFSIYAQIMAVKHKAPATVFLINGMLPLVPGSGMYQTMYASMLGDSNRALLLGIETISSAATIAIGVVFVYSVHRVILQRKHR